MFFGTQLQRDSGPGEGGEQWSGSTGGEVIIPAVTWSLITPSILFLLDQGEFKLCTQRTLPYRAFCLFNCKNALCKGWLDALAAMLAR